MTAPLAELMHVDYLALALAGCGLALIACVVWREW